MPRLVSSNPKYQKHRASGQAVVTLDGQDFYLGPFGSKASKVEYDRLIGEWLANGRRVPQRQADVSVAEVLETYLRFAEGYYTATACGYASEWETTKQALRYPALLYSATPAESFGPLALKTCREAMIKDGLCRTHINQQVGRIKRMFKWAVEQELIAAEVWHALQAVAGLRAGKTEARESEPVRPVDEAHVRSTLPRMSRTIRAMVQLQLATGMRPGEVCAMRGVDIDTTVTPGTYIPAHHKTEYRGHQRVIYLGPRAQAIVQPLLKPDLAAYIFAPADSDAWHRQLRSKNRKTPGTCGNVAGCHRARRRRRAPGDRFDVGSYRRAITRACDIAFPLPEHLRRIGVPARGRKTKAARWETDAEWKNRLGDKRWPEIARWRDEHRWHPHQLRHTAATNLRKEYGLEAAQVILGHKTLTVTQVYAEKNVEAARKIMAQVG